MGLILGTLTKILTYPLPYGKTSVCMSDYPNLSGGNLLSCGVLILTIFAMINKDADNNKEEIEEDYESSVDTDNTETEDFRSRVSGTGSRRSAATSRFTDSTCLLSETEPESELEEDFLRYRRSHSPSHTRSGKIYRSNRATRKR